jgi:hypothetical protein
MRRDAGVIAMVLILALIGAGCAPKPAEDAKATGKAAPGAARVAETPETARKAGQLAAAIEREPARLAELLAGQGWTAEAYQTLLVEIAASPGLTETYEAARTGS